MITEFDIQKAVNEKLAAAGFHVIPPETEEGFAKPAVFTAVYPAEVERLSHDRERVSETVEILRIPKTETLLDQTLAAQKIRFVLFYEPLDVKERRLTFSAMRTEIENYILHVYFDTEFIQETPCDEEYEGMEELGLNGV